MPPVGLRLGGSKVVFALCAALSASGCGTSTGKGEREQSLIPAGDVARGASVRQAPVDPDEALRKQLHAAAYQIDQALDRLATATESVQTLPSGEAGETKKALLDLLTKFDAAGRRLNDGNEAPELAEIQKDRSAAQRRLGKRKEELRESIVELKSTQSTLEDMLASEPPEKEKTALQSASQAVEESLDFLNEALDVLN